MHSIDEDLLRDCATAVEYGELVALPTKRWYMICADASNTKACTRIFDAKHRARTKPLVLAALSLHDCEQRFALTSEARVLAEEFWPGDLALLLPWRDQDEAARLGAVGAPALVTQDDSALGELAALASVPVAATTVNISGADGVHSPAPAISAQEVEAFTRTTGTKIALIADGGICPAANHLTIVDCTEPRARTVRPGLIHDRALAAALGRPMSV